MQTPYAIGRLSIGQIDQAYLLVNPVAPGLDLDGWRSFCRNLLAHELLAREQDDVIVAANPLGYVQGLSVCAVRTHPSHGRILDVPVFVVASTADEAGVRADLLRHLQECGGLHGCRMLRIWSLEWDSWGRHLDSHEIDRNDHGILIDLPAGDGH